jgi:hypothetical protein
MAPHDPIRRAAVILTAAILIAGLALPGAAQAGKKVTYAGTLANGGKIALDVKLGKHKRPKEILEVRAVDLRLKCKKSGKHKDGYAQFIGPVPVTRKGLFDAQFGQDGYDNRSRIEGDFDRKDVAGTYVFDFDFQAEPDLDLPEEDCTTGEVAFEARRGAEDQTKPYPPQRHARR